MATDTDQTAAPADAGGAQVTEEDLFAVRAITEEARRSGSGVYLQPDTVDRLLFSLAAREEARPLRDALERMIEVDPATEYYALATGQIRVLAARTLGIQGYRHLPLPEPYASTGKFSEIGRLEAERDAAREEARTLLGVANTAEARMIDAEAERDQAREEARVAKEHVLELENIVVTWGVDCEHCAQYLDSGLTETFRAEKAEKECDAARAEAARLRETMERIVEYGGQTCGEEECTDPGCLSSVTTLMRAQDALDAPRADDAR